MHYRHNACHGVVGIAVLNENMNKESHEKHHERHGHANKTHTAARTDVFVVDIVHDIQYAKNTGEE